MMQGSNDPASPVTFWRCGLCGTPNPARAYLTHCLGCGEQELKANPNILELPSSRSPNRGRWIAIASWAYAVLILLILALISWVGDAWWGVTVLLFLPRWLFLGPILVLALASAVRRKPSQWVLQGTIALVVAGPLMGFSLPPDRLWNRPVEGAHFRIMTYNVGPGPIDDEGLIRLIERERIDLITFQEHITVNPKLEAYLSRGWYRDRTLYVASRFPIIADFEPMKDTTTTDDRYGARLSEVRVRTPQGLEFIVASVHMPTIRPGLYRFLDGKPSGLVMQMKWWRSELGRVVSKLSESSGVPMLVGGDFNMPSDDSSMTALGSIFRFGFEDVGVGYGYTRPSNIPWFRIDHLMASPHWTFRRCWVGPDFGSDHLPLIAEVVFPAKSRAPLAGGR